MDNWETTGTATQIGSQNDEYAGLDMFSSLIFVFLIIMVSLAIFTLTKRLWVPVIVFVVLFSVLCFATGG